MNLNRLFGTSKCINRENQRAYNHHRSRILRAAPTRNYNPRLPKHRSFVQSSLSHKRQNIREGHRLMNVKMFDRLIEIEEKVKTNNRKRINLHNKLFGKKENRFRANKARIEDNIARQNEVQITTFLTLQQLHGALKSVKPVINRRSLESHRKKHEQLKKNFANSKSILFSF